MATNESKRRLLEEAQRRNAEEHAKLLEEFQRRKEKKEIGRYSNLEEHPDFRGHYSRFSERMLKFDGRIIDFENDDGRRVLVGLYEHGRGNEPNSQQLTGIRVPFNVLAKRGDAAKHFTYDVYGGGQVLCQYLVIADLSREEGKGIDYYFGKSNSNQKNFKKARCRLAP